MKTVEIDGTIFQLYDIKVIDKDIKSIYLEYSKPDPTKLHQYGNRQFCKFTLSASKEVLSQKGLYCFVADGEVKYVGKCSSSFELRINNGYGNISPRNCYKGGQSTNCHINSEVNKLVSNGATLQVGIAIFSDDETLSKRESELILSLANQSKNIWNKQINYSYIKEQAL